MIASIDTNQPGGISSQGLAAAEALGRTVVASIGPTTSEELHAQHLDVDLEPTHPRMGVLVRETAERARALVALKAARH